MPGRHLNDWLQGYLEYTQNQESPERLHFWTGLAILSAATKRQIFMDRGYYKLYPNIYVLIVAESARIRKSVAMDIGVDLIRRAVPDLFYISGTLTPEGLVKHMNRVNIIATESGRTLRYDSHVFVHADELAELFGYDKTRAAKLTILLTKIYGAQAEHMHTLATENQILLKNLYPTLLAGTDPRNLKVLPEEAVGGLIGRVIFVTATEKRKPIAWPRPSEHERKLYNYLKEDLHMISQLHGEMIPAPEARLRFQQWYEAQSEVKSDDPRIEAFRERCHDTALKLSMLLSLSRSNALTISDELMLEGIRHIENQLPEFSRVANWAVATAFAQTRARFIDLLRRQGGAGMRRQALKALNISLEELSTVEATLEQEGTIEIRVMGKNVFYKLSGEELRK